MMLNVTRIKEDVTALSYDIIRRNGFSVKFKVKTHYEGINKQTQYYYNSYLFNSGNRKRTSISFTPKSYIQFDFGVDDGKNVFFLSEVYKNRFVRKLDQLIQLLEAYDSGEIDIVKVDSSGTHISNKFPREIKISLGNNIAIITTCIREEKMDIGVNIKFNNMSATIALYDFLELMEKLKSINYTMMSMLLLNHIGAPELGSNETDFRPEKITGIENREKEFNSFSGNKSSLFELKNQQTSNYNKTSW
jgi:predicted SnoaL-like aldol condensation-catalyzing enzyme